MSVLIVLAILVIAASVTQRHNFRFDFTANQRYSLAPQSRKILASLTRDVAVTGFFQDTGSPRVEAVRELLDRYAAASPRFRQDVVDMDRNPIRTRAAGVTKPGTILVESGDKAERLNRLTEESLTGALARITRPGRKVVYFLAGHGEKDPESSEKNGYSEAVGLIEDQGYEVKPLALARTNGVPADASVLVAAGPRRDFLPVEIGAIETYLHGGGRVMFLLDPESGDGMNELLTRLKVKLGRDYVVDPLRHAFGGDYLMPMATQYDDFPAAEGFKLMTFYPVARSVWPDGSGDGVEVKTMVLTGPEAWAETDSERLKGGSAQFNAGQDLKGPVSLAVAGKIKTDAGGPDSSRVGEFVVFGDSDFASNGYIHLQGNGDLFQMVLSQLARETDLVAIRPAKEAYRPLALTAIQARLVFWLPVVVLPLAVLGVGLLVLGRRRKMA